MKLPNNIFVQCICGYDLKFTQLEQVRSCPQCQKLVQITYPIQQYLIKEHHLEGSNSA